MKINNENNIPWSEWTIGEQFNEKLPPRLTLQKVFKIQLFSFCFWKNVLSFIKNWMEKKMKILIIDVNSFISKKRTVCYLILFFMLSSTQKALEV